MTDRPISIVIPTYNRSNTLRAVFPSYVDQEAVREIIIVDDASTDDTPSLARELCERYSHVHYVKGTTKLGLPAARNLGVDRSTGDYVLFGEDDLRYGPGYAAQLLACLERTGGAIAAGRIVFLFPGESDEQALERANVPVGERLDRKRLIWNASAPAGHDIEVPLIHAISLVRRRVFDSVRYDPAYRGNAYREETDFYLRARQVGHRIFFCPAAVCIHLPREVRKLGGSMAQGIWIYKYWSIRNNWRFLRRHYHYLEEEGLVDSSFSSLMVAFATAEAIKILSFYLRRYAPGLYARLARRPSQYGSWPGSRAS